MRYFNGQPGDDCRRPADPPANLTGGHPLATRPTSGRWACRAPRALL